MKRLLEQIGLTYLSVLAVVFYFGSNLAVCLTILSAVAFLIFISVKRFRKTIYMPAVALTIIIACVINLSYTEIVYDKTVDRYSEKSGVVTAKLLDEPQKMNGYYVYKFNAEQLFGEQCDFDFIGYYDELFYMEPFDSITIETQFSTTDNKSNITKGYYLQADFGYDTAQYSVHHNSDKPFYYHAIKWRQNIREAINSTLSKDAASLCNALLIGDKNALSETYREDFRRSGVSHLIVVSGLHFSILASFFFWISRKLRRFRLFILVPTFFLMIVYMNITGNSASVLRSGIMMLIYGFGILISRDPYSGNSLGLAAIIVLFIFGPYSAGDISLILSFVSTYSIIILAPKLYENFSKRIKFNYDKKRNKFRRLMMNVTKSALSLICMNISAFVVSLPLSIIFFGSVSTVSVITSFILHMPIQILLLTSVLVSIIYYLPVVSFLTPVLAFIIECFSSFTLSVVSTFSSLNISYLYVNNNYVYLWLGFTVILCFIAWLSYSKYRVRILMLSSILIFLFGYLSSSAINSDIATLNVYDVKNGTAVVYDSYELNAVLDFDCSTSYRNKVINKLEHYVDSVDYCSSVSGKIRSTRCAYSLAESFAIDNILLYDNKSEILLPDSVDNVLTPTDVYTVKLSDKCNVEYRLINEEYITCFDTGYQTVLILPRYFDASNIPENLRTADIIIVSSAIANYELLSCDTLIISTSSDYADYIMSTMHSISNRVLLTKDSDIKILMEV